MWARQLWFDMGIYTVHASSVDTIYTTLHASLLHPPLQVELAWLSTFCSVFERYTDFGSGFVHAS